MNELQKEAYELADKIEEVYAHMVSDDYDLEVLKEQLVQTEIEVDTKFRIVSANNGTKITEKIVENVITCNPNVGQFKEMILDKKKEIGLHKATLEGLRTKREMITAISRMGG